MKVKNLDMLLAIFGAVLSGVLLFLAFPSYDLDFLAWIGLVPFYLAINGKRAIYSFILSYLSGVVFFLGIFNWILEVPGYTQLHHAILALYLGSYFGFLEITLTLQTCTEEKRAGVRQMWLSTASDRS